MQLYQSSVLNKYLATQDAKEVAAAYEKYSTYFLNPDIQENIRNSKEEQFQEGFLRELFVNILGYTINPNPDFNLTTELKNIKDAKKTDGAILKANGAALAVIELKGTDTKDLSKVNDQAFNYKNNQPECIYVITSNFEKLRFFIHNAVSHEEFNLFSLSKDRFALLWLFLQKDNLLSGIPAKVKEESLLEEDRITKELYKDYSSFKNDLWTDIVKQNPQHDALLLYKKSQKLLDRFLFIFFAEDKGLLPPNSISAIIEQWEKLKELDEYKPLYARFKKYFGYMNDGYKGAKYKIHAYNGGLFKADELLDNLLIDDELLKKHCLKLTNYDFADEVDTNILGHIFEHSLNDIENVRAQLAGEEVDKSKTKRKKDGVFYTPKYITKYIVDNTVGKLCEEKKAAIGIDDEEFAKDRKGRKRATIIKLDGQLKEYREWLLQLTICDPACGSGAFLNQALEFLIAEHSYVDELEASLFDGSIVFPDVENHILENNIFGVDINEESVEIARLSLWLRTAQKGRKLTSLSSNIKCGNSLIDAPEVAGVLAFNWQEQFAKVFGKEGFDVVIGNPPYVRVQSLKEHYFDQTLFYEKKYKSATGKYDLYALFIEKSFSLINANGVVSFILPHKFLVSDFGIGIRSFLVEKKAVDSLVHFGSKIVFQDAATYTCIVNLKKQNEFLRFAQVNPSSIISSFEFGQIDYKNLSSKAWQLKDSKTSLILSKITSETQLNNLCEGIYQGLITTGDDIFMLEGENENGVFTGYSKALDGIVKLESDILKEVLKGQDIKRYLPLKSRMFVIYPHKINEKGKTIPLEEDEFKSKNPLTYEYLENFKEHLISKKVRYKTNPKYWYSLHRSREISIFEKEYIITPQLQNFPSFTIKETDVYADAGGYLLLPKKEINFNGLLAILNSKVLWFFIKNTSSEYGGGYFYFKTKYLESFGIPLERLNSSDFNRQIESRLKGAKKYNTVIDTFIKYFQSKLTIDKVTKNLQNWHELDFKDFLAELKKAKIPKLSLEDEADWMEYFNKKKAEANALQSEIDRLEKEIDHMVYELYGLSEREIAIVENN